MFRTLYSRLALMLFALLCVVGVILSLLMRESSVMYQQEVMQKLNSQLARHVVTQQALIRDGRVDREAMEHLFHQLMVVNPLIEMYLLDPRGEVLGFSAPRDRVRRTRVDLGPLEQFFEADARLPILGDDPRNVTGRKIFSAARIRDGSELQGYLYIVLGGEKYDQAMLMLRDSYILDSALFILLSALGVALLCGLAGFAVLTRRLRRLGGVMRRYAESSDDEIGPIRFTEIGKPRDEIDELGQQFNAMADKIQVQLEKLRRMDGVRREMVANVSHDLRTPLTTMRGYLETLQLKHEQLSAEERKQYLQTALLHSQRLGDLVEELFELARLDSCESVVYSEPFSIGELVQDVAQSFQLRAQQKQVRLDARLQPNVPLVYGDIAMMQRVLENLIENGLRHTSAGGRIAIDVDVDSGKVVVRISDTGCGIAAEDVPRIFERFYQRDRGDGGEGHSGLGLAIVKRILELHGSAIEVHSSREAGTTFSFQVKSTYAS